MKYKKGLITIVIPIYNAEKYLQKCLESIVPELRNDKENLELILIDDGSTDESSKIYEKFYMENVRVVKNSNKGVSFSRNLVINLAKGEWILFIDADDIMNKNWYENVTKLKQQDVDIIYFNKNFSGKSISKDILIKEIAGINSNFRYIATPWSKMYRTKFLVENKIYFYENIINGEDMLFNIQALLKAKKYKISNISIYKYRSNATSVTHQFNEKIIDSDKYFHVKMHEILVDNKLNESVVNDISEYCLQNAIYTLLQRICYINKYKYLKSKMVELSYMSPYCNIKDFSKLTKKKKIICKFFIKKMYIIVYLIFKLNMLFSHRKKLTSEFLEI